MIRRYETVSRVALVGFLLLQTTLVGCAATRGRRGEPTRSGFLGDYSELKENPDYPAAQVYVRPGVEWSRYDSIHIDSAGLWLSEETKKLSQEDQQMLTDMLFAQMSKALSAVFKVVDEPGPNTLRVRAALTQAQGAHVVARVVTTVVPQLRAAGGLIGLAGDTALTVGAATSEMEILDAVTNERLAAAVDSRAGTKVLFAKRTFQTWGDVEAACERWASRMAWQLARVGVQRKAGVPMPPEPSEHRSL